MGCEYCDNSKSLPLMKENGEWEAFIMGLQMIEFVDWRSYDRNGIFINYCPMCGRNLIGVNDWPHLQRKQGDADD